VADKKGFILYQDYAGPVGLLSDEDAGRLLKALFAHAAGDEACSLDGAAGMAYTFIAAQMDRDDAKYARKCAANAANGARGGRPRKKPTEPNAPDTAPQEPSSTEDIPAEARETEDNPRKPNETERLLGKPRKPYIDEEEDTNTDNLPPTPRGGKSAPVPYGEIMALYNATCTSLPRITIIDGQRRKAVAARWRTYHDMEPFRQLFQRAQASSFLRGRNDRNWVADFDWLVRPTNMAKVLEGKYDNEKGAPHGTDPQPPGRAIPQPQDSPHLSGFQLAGEPGPGQQDDGLEQ
jgi:hypothetical protein